MVEMDIIFGSFARAVLPSMEEGKLLEYDTVLRQFDNDLNNWLVNGTAAPKEIEALGVWRDLRTFLEKNKEELLGHRL